jgi:hypothetical protein
MQYAVLPETEVHDASKHYAKVSSAPQGAHVYIDGLPSGTTPTVVYLADDERHALHVELAGYAPMDWDIVADPGLPGADEALRRPEGRKLPRRIELHARRGGYLCQ